MDQLGARRVDGYSALRFRLEADAVVEASERATVLDIAGRHFACGDFGGMPVLGAGPGAATRLGLNVEPLVEALRAAGLPDRPTGAAHVRLVDRAGVPAHIQPPFGLLIYGCQSVRNQGGLFVEGNLDLVVAAIKPGQDPVLLGGDDRAAIMRNLLSSPLRRDGGASDALLDALHRADETLSRQLRIPTVDRATRFALFPVAAVAVD